MRFTSALALSAVSFLGASAAPGGPQGYGWGASSSAPAPAQSSSASSGTTNNPPSSGSGSGSPAPPPPSSICPPDNFEYCCSSISTNAPSNSGNPSASSSNANGGLLLSGLLSGLLGAGALNNPQDLLNVQGVLTCGLSGVLGQGDCNDNRICCVQDNENPDGKNPQTCTNKNGANVQVPIAVGAGILGTGTAAPDASN